MNKFSPNIAFLLTVFLLGILLHKNYLNDFPNHIHTWTQSDRYAIAKGFINNGMNFLLPETYVSFSKDGEQPPVTTITAVDFPIHDYIVAFGMKILTTESPWIFRAYNLLYSFLGLFYLFKLTKRLTKNSLLGLFIVMFTSSSPVFVYYQSGFLPTIPSLSNIFIAFYFYICYLSENKRIHFHLSIIFLTLAAMARVTFLIPLIAVLAVETIRILKGKTTYVDKIPATMLAILSFGGYLWYNHHLKTKYSNIFLDFLMPAESLQEVTQVLIKVKKTWLFQYFSGYHYTLLSLFAVITIILLLRKKNSLDPIQKNILALVGLIGFGCLSFFFLMMLQFPDHDYYFLDTFFSPFILLLVLMSSVLVTHPLSKKRIVLPIMFLATIPMIINASQTQKSRRATGNWDRVSATERNFEGSEHFLDSLNLSKNKKYLVLDPYAPNVPFLKMNRKGYVVLSTTKHNLKASMDWDFDYLIFQNEFFLSDIYTQLPSITSYLKPICTNGKITICSKGRSKRKHDLLDFIGLTNREARYTNFLNFESASGSEWSHANRVQNHHYSEGQACLMTPDQEFGLTFKSSSLHFLKKQQSTLTIQGKFYVDSTANKSKNIALVAAISQEGKSVYYKSFNLENQIKEYNQWENIQLMYELPVVTCENHELAFYLWNIGKTKLLLDELTLSIY